MGCETITISKDEYIDLLRCKSDLKERELASTKTASSPPRKPHSWMNQAEKEEIRRLSGLGMRPGEIGEQVGRPSSTVRRCIKKMAGD